VPARVRLASQSMASRAAMLENIRNESRQEAADAESHGRGRAHSAQGDVSFGSRCRCAHPALGRDEGFA